MSIVRRLARRTGTGRSDADSRLQGIKLRAIDAAIERTKAASFADIGGVWAVEAGYTFWTLEHLGIERGVLVDSGITDSVRDRAARTPGLTLVSAAFDDDAALNAVNGVDMVFLFDVLLHQVTPDWDDILRMYAERTNTLVIVNPQYVAGTETIRLIDLGRERYEAIVPHTPVHDEAFEHLDAIHPTYGKPWRDIHEIWQWGMVSHDLDAACRNLGFRLVHWESNGTWFGQPAFDHEAFVYIRDDEARGRLAPTFAD